MRGNGLKHETTTTGTGALTLTGVTGWPSYDDVFGTSGTRWVEYTILDADGVPIEGGVGSLALSTMVLTRSYVQWTWTGTTYDRTSPAALSLASGTKQVLCTPAADNMLAVTPPMQPDYSSYTTGRGPLLASYRNSSNATWSNGQMFAYLLYWPHAVTVDRVRTKCGTALGGTPSSTYTGIGIYRFGSGGMPDTPLAIFDAWTTNPMVSTAVQVSDPLATPVFLPPGLYWWEFLMAWTGGTGSPQWETAGDAVSWGVTSAFATGQRQVTHFYTNSQTSLTDPSATPTALGGAPNAVPHVSLWSA